MLVQSLHAAKPDCHVAFSSIRGCHIGQRALMPSPPRMVPYLSSAVLLCVNAYWQACCRSQDIDMSLWALIAS